MVSAARAGANAARDSGKSEGFPSKCAGSVGAEWARSSTSWWSGPGPAGIGAALTAAARGCSVVCIDKARFPRDKTCGDGLTTGALRLLERLGVTRDELVAAGMVAVRETVLVSPTGRRVTLPLPDDGGIHAAVIARRDLDAALVAVAGRAGVDVREGCNVEKIAPHADEVELLLADGTSLHARRSDRGRRALVDGRGVRSSPMRPATSANGTPCGSTSPTSTTSDCGSCSNATCCRATRGCSRCRVAAPTSATACCAPTGRRGRDLKALWPELLARPVLREILGARAHAVEPVRAWPIPTRYDPARLANGRVLFVGDAAGVVDPMTGEGIAQALETGVLAADSIATGGDADAVSARYRRSVGRTLGRDLRFASALQTMLRHPLGARAAIAAAGATSWTRRNFARWMFEDYPRAQILTPDRWRRGAFTAPGAFGMP